MARGKMDMDNRPNTLKENKLVLCELRSRNKNDNKSFHEINKIIAKFNGKNLTKFSKNAKTSIVTKQEKIPENPYGHLDGFPPGTWWGIRMDCSRDRVHQPFNDDIQEGPFGAVSICTSHLNSNNDVDLGDYLTFTSKDYITEAQQSHSLLRNYQNQLPLRLIRSYNLTNDYAPKTGYRYDGLYSVVACWIGVTSASEKHYKFALARLPHQDSLTCQYSRESTGARMKNFQHTRSSVDRFATSIFDDSRNSVNDEEITRNVRSRSLTTRCTLKRFNISNNDSDIVTRCISKKSEGQSCSGMVSVPYAETSVTSNNRLIDDNSTNLNACKLQNTNISIRTDLYDSSNSMHHETRKTIPMTFCRTYKNSRSTGRISNHTSSVVSLNLNSCGPCPRDNVQESLIQSRSGIAKLSSDQSPSLDLGLDRTTPKSSTIINTDRGTSFYDKTTCSSPIVNETIVEMPVSSSNQISQRVLEKKHIDTENRLEKVSNFDAKISTDINNKEIRENERFRTNDETKSSKSLEITCSDETTIDEFTRKNCTDLDSLTPDQMLNLIVQQKYHPTAKLLIGSVIGLSTGESTILRAYESLMSRKNCHTPEKTQRNEETAINSYQMNVENSSIVESQNYDIEEKSINKDTTSNERNIAKILPNTRILRANKDRLMRKMNLRRTRVSKRLLGTEKKSNTNNVRSSNAQRLRKTNIKDVKKQQQFSKSTILKKSKKNTKKRRGELANLVIDANIGPLIRGPRNRRLRCRTHIFGKKRHGNNDTVTNCCAVKNTNVTRGGKKIISRIDLTARKSKVSIVKSQNSQSHISENVKRVRENVRNYHQEGRVKILSKNVKTGVENSSKNHRSITGEKRKLSRTLSHERVDDRSRKISRNDSQNSVNKRRIKMIDATTQCSTSMKDATTCTERNIFQTSGSIENPTNSIKIEWIDVDDVKSEIYDSNDESDLSIHETNERVQDFYENQCFSTNQRDTTMRNTIQESRTLIPPRLSAFVPVNISDVDSRISRLRSIGFKPIQSVDNSHNDKQLSSLHEDNVASTSDKSTYEKRAVVSREVDELYNKYTSEETTMVGYMDEELRYEDIEDEESRLIRKNKIVYGRAKRGGRIGRLRNDEIDKNDCTREPSVSLNEEDSEVPWHGWKKFVKNKQAQWIGW